MVGRQKELSALEAQYNRPKSSLFVLYGRRRLGKTALLREFLRGKPAVYYLASDENETENRRAFQKAAADAAQGALAQSEDADTWEAMFREIATRAKDGQRVVIVLDEFQTLAKASADFPAMLRRVWDTVLRRSNVMLVLSGSDIRQVESQALDDNSPLGGAHTGALKLRPIPFSQFGLFYPDASPSELLQLYAITGGVPKYAEVFGPRSGIFYMIQKHVLDPSSFLYEEPERLLREEIRDIGTYASILRLVAGGAEKLADISSALGVPQTHVSPYLSNLARMDLLEREVPVTEEIPEKSRRGMHRIPGNFLRFWFRYVYPNRSMLEMGQPGPVMEKIRKDFAGHVRRVYADVCRERAAELIEDGTWPVKLRKLGSWWDGQTEMDIMGIGEDSVLYGISALGSGPVGQNALMRLLRLSALLSAGGGPSREEYYAIFSTGGFTEELQEAAAKDTHILLGR